MPKKTKEEIKEARLYKTYGIKLVDWNRMFNDQGGVCWICKTMPKNNVLCIDHIHVKGYKKMPPEEKIKYIRGLLCFQCNTAFGRLERRKQPRQLLNRIVEYFKSYKIKGDI